MLLGPRARGGAVFGPLCYSGLPRDGAARGVAAGGTRRGYGSVATSADNALGGRGRGRLLAQLHAWIASVLPPLANARRMRVAANGAPAAVAATRRYLKTTYLCSKEPMLARLGRFRCGAII